MKRCEDIISKTCLGQTKLLYNKLKIRGLFSGNSLIRSIIKSFFRHLWTEKKIFILSVAALISYQIATNEVKY